MFKTLKAHALFLTSKIPIVKQWINISAGSSFKPLSHLPGLGVGN